MTVDDVLKIAALLGAAGSVIAAGAGVSYWGGRIAKGVEATADGLRDLTAKFDAHAEALGAVKTQQAVHDAHVDSISERLARLESDDTVLTRARRVRP